MQRGATVFISETAISCPYLLATHGYPIHVEAFLYFIDRAMLDIVTLHDAY